MKDFICTIMLLGLALQLPLAQGNFAPLGAKWTYSTLLFVPPNTFGPYTMEVEAIEVFQGRMCSRIYMPDSPWGPWIEDLLYVYEENDSVYYWSPFSEDFELLYDFTAEVGDSWVVGGLDVTDTSEYDDFLTVRIDSIVNIVLNGDSLIIMYHNPYNDPFDWGSAIIEGIGSNGFMFPSFGLYELAIGELRCYSDAEHDYQFVLYSCDSIFTTATTELNKNVYKVSISPNPVDQNISITSNQFIRKSSVKIYSTYGQLVYSERLEIPGSLNLHFLPSGIFVCQIFSGNKLLHIERIIKIP